MERKQRTRREAKVGSVVMVPEGRVDTGVEGLDHILNGGLLPGRAYLVHGGPGCGKTTLGLHFLTTGARAGEPALFISLGEPEDELRQDAQIQGFDMDRVAFLDLSPPPDLFAQARSYDIFTPAEVEPSTITKRIMAKLEEVRPRRIFIDSMTQFRYLSPDVFQFRKQALAFLRYLIGEGATVLFTSEGTVREPDDDLQFISDGIIRLDYEHGERTLAVTKFRGSSFRGGSHSMQLTPKGIEVFPRLLPSAYRRAFVAEPLASGVPALDELLHGGLERGTITIITGPSGTGKTTVGLQFMKEAAGRGERSVVYSFEEEIDLILHRCEGINIPARTMVERGTLSLVKIEPLKFSPDEFAKLVRLEVEQRDTSIVMLDSVAGYRLSLAGSQAGAGDDLVSHLHALCKYLQNMGVAVLLVNEVERISGDFRITDNHISYLADNVIYMRYLERINPQGAMELRKAIGVLKKRTSDFDKTLREIEITRYGLVVGEPLRGVSGMLSQMPVWHEREDRSGT
jgi:circadian clock protein KaiC